MKKKEKITTNLMLMYRVLKKNKGEKIAREAVNEVLEERRLRHALREFNSLDKDSSYEH